MPRSETARDQFGGIDCVLNAAGHAAFGPIEEWTFEDWHRMMTVHAGGTFLVCKHVLPIMRAAGRWIDRQHRLHGCAHGQQQQRPVRSSEGQRSSRFSRQLAREAAPTVRVNIVAPGRVRTGMTEPLFASRGGTAEEGAKQFGMANMQQRVAEPDELAAPICFLLSDEASFITGTLLVVDGGETAM